MSLKNNINDQENYTKGILEKLKELGFLNNSNNDFPNDELDENEIDE